MTPSATHSILPSLSPDESSHSEAAAALIRERIAADGGWVAFEKFMELALYAPGLGYYSAGSVKIGAGGDFVTAPETSDLFSRCVAHQIAEVLAATGGEILELGAGTGRMAAVILESLREQDLLPDRYAILEVSADLRQRQAARLRELAPDLRGRIEWLDRLPEKPIHGVLVANEVLDALPFQRFVIRDGKPRELGVALESGSFTWREAPESLRVAGESAFRRVPLPLPDGYVSEVCRGVEPWIAGVGECLGRGLMLLFDYGLPRAHYYHPQRADGTLRCHFKQRAHGNPFINIAVQDITAWVDFTTVAEAASDARLDVAGFATQAAFLLGTGIESLAARAGDTLEQARLAGEARRLLMPDEMGESFKVMALTREYREPLRGFACQDLRGSL